jgi:cyanophycin synthetase
LAPDPFSDIRMTTLHATRGANYWSRSPVTRMDLVVGPYEDISSADAPGFTDALMAAMPGLIEHRCSIGERGGFLIRLRDGTYAPHVVEHVALELQTMVGHDVGYGRTRGGDTPDTYTLVLEHLYEAVGLRAAALALETVQRAFAGTLDSVDHAVTELAALAEHADVPPPRQRVLCGISGGCWRAEARAELTRRGVAGDGDVVVDVSPGYLLQAGLPYARAELAIVMDTTLTDVPERYQDRERARRLMSVMADGLPRGRVLVVPAKEWEIQDYARDSGCGVAVFAADDNVTRRDKRVARTAGFVDGGRVVIEHRGETHDAGPIHGEAPPAAQVVAAIAEFTLRDARDAQPAAAAHAPERGERRV